MNIQLDYGDGNMLSIVEQIEYAKKLRIMINNKASYMEAFIIYHCA